MTISWLVSLFERDLDRLKKEIELYSDEKIFWKTEKGIANTAGNLSLHLIGNLSHFIGATLGKNDYVRDREKEFSDKNIAKSEILLKLAVVRDTVSDVLQNLDEKDLVQTFPINVWGEEIDTGYFLIHLATHLNYHLGQINYHRRLLDVGT